MFPVGIYPYMNLQDLNLDYVLRMIDRLRHDVDDFVEMNAIKYAVPIQWDITRQYEKNTIVIDPATGSAYLSVCPVPVGIDISRAEYWTEVFNLDAIIANYAENLTEHDAGDALVSPFTLSPGEWVISRFKLYVVTSAIVPGDQFTEGGNVARLTVEEAIKTLIGEIEAVALRIGELNDLETPDKSDLVSAINSEFAYLRSIAVNVAEEGADNTGGTDCTPILNDLATKYRVLYFPAGTYKLSGAVYLKSNSYVFGSGATLTTENDTHGFVINNEKDVVVSGLEFVMTHTPRYITANAIYIEESERVKVTNCKVTNFGTAVAVHNSNAARVEDCRVERCDVGIIFDGDVTDSSKNYDNSACGCSLYDCGATPSIFGRWGERIKIENNYISGSGSFGASLQECGGSTIKGNYTVNSKKEGYNLQDCAACDITKNICEWRAGTGYGVVYGTDFGISLWGTNFQGNCNQCAVRNNFVNNSYKAAIAVWGECYGTDVNGNKLINCPNAGASVSGGGAAIKLGQDPGATGIPYESVVQSNDITPRPNMNAIESMAAFSTLTSINNNETHGFPIVSGNANDTITNNGTDVIDQVAINTGGVSGTIFYSRNDTRVRISAYLTISGASAAPAIDLPYPAKMPLRALSLSAVRVAQGSQGYGAYIDNDGRLVIINDDGLPPADGALFLFGEYFYM